MTPPDDQSRPAPRLGAEGRIIEGLVATRDEAGNCHIAPMGPLVGAQFDRLWLRPFVTSSTYQNLRLRRAGVFHTTDDVEMLAAAAIGALRPLPAVTPAAAVEADVIVDACMWFAFEVESVDDSTERSTIAARVVDRGVLREFTGFNRAKHAVVEAAILATRVRILPAEQIIGELERLALPIQKTGSAAEVRAFAMLKDYVRAIAGAAKT
ncbi:MAG TPA: DUF447 domain-containing protein [Lacipirellulaceae bacterium]|nr:DUF447 domain-containing protein [Lacipirellulaceae bacterium]